VRLAEFDCALEGAAMWIARADVQYRRDACSMRALDDLLAIRIKLRAINVRMRVDEHPAITSSGRRSARLP